MCVRVATATLSDWEGGASETALRPGRLLGACAQKVAQECELVVGVVGELLVESLGDLPIERPGASVGLRGGLDHDAPPVGRVPHAPHVPDPLQTVDDDRYGGVGELALRSTVLNSTQASSQRRTAEVRDGFVLETHGLGKRYGERILAVDRLSMRVRRGEVYGFLGPNGAGKTTTLRMLLGLIRPTEGSALVLGAAPGTPEGLARIGALVETPAFYPFLSGRDNLRVLARHAGVREARIQEVLDEVDLSKRADDRLGTYSLGMKQRLGVAAALLKGTTTECVVSPGRGATRSWRTSPTMTAPPSPTFIWER
jgi:ABC-type transport system involved in cytochrome c biogenesis ATPase subunit